jgi:hypothetical protein
MKTLLTTIFVAGITFGIFSQPLNGSYTVGGQSPDFATLQNAAHALFINGISGPVFFNIRPGTYMKQGSPGPVLRLDTLIAGVSEINRITFQPDAQAGGNRENTTMQIDCDVNTDYNNDREIFYIKSNYVTIRNLTFKDADSLDSPARYLLRIESIVFQPLIEDLVVDGCKFIGSPFYTSGQQFGTDYGIHTFNLNTGSISNNKFNNFMRATGFNAEGYDPGDSIIIEDNKFENLYLGFSGAGTPLGAAIEERFAHVFIRRNFVSNSTGARGIAVIFPITAVVEANYVRGNFQSEIVLGLNSASQDRTDSSIVLNNVVLGPGAGGGSIFIETRNTKIFHNTIINTGGNGGLRIYGHDCKAINNVLKSSSNTIIVYDISGAVGIISDHNVFFKSPGQWYFAHDVANNYYTTFESYRNATGLDTNSTFTDVTFDFDSLGIHLDECQAQDNALDGIHLPEVPFDFYGARRDSVKPFVGAVEGVRLPYDMYGEPFRTALTGFPLSIASGNFDNSSGPGIAVPDWDNNQVLLFHNNGATRTFTQTGTINTTYKPTVVRLFDFDKDNKLDLIVSGDTNAVEIFWGDGNGNFSSHDIVETFGRVRSMDQGPSFSPDISTIITTEDNGFLPSTSFIGYVMNTTGRELCYDVQRSGLNNDVDTIHSVLTDFVLSDLGAGSGMPAIVAPGLFGNSNVIPKFFAFDVEALGGWVLCQNTNLFFHSSDHEYNFPTTGNYTNSSSIITGDFDGDLDNDFITTGWNDNYCVFIKNNGSFTFSADTIFTAATRGIAPLDYENDGDLDFVTINNTLDSLGITVFLNDGVGNFEEKRNCFLPFASGHPNGIVAADFDQDGNTDVAIVSRTPFGGDSLFVLYNLGGFNQATGVEVNNLSDETPDKFELSQNYPNPFNPSTKINFELPLESNVKIFVYNILGEKVRELVNSQMSSGVHTIDFNASSLASGIYIYTIEAKTISGEGNFITAKKMILLK